MRISALRHSIAIQAEQTTPDGMGGQVRTWDTVATVWASIEPLKGREFFAAQQTQSAVTHKVTIRYCPGVTTAHRILFGERIFEITAVLDAAEQHRWLTLMCTEQVPNG